jgi:hypothetical protein
MRTRWRVSFGAAPVFRPVAFDRASDARVYKSESGDSEWGGRRRRAGAKSLLELRKQLSGSPAFAIPASLQRLQDPDKVLVADPLELTDGKASRLWTRAIASPKTKSHL